MIIKQVINREVCWIDGDKQLFDEKWRRRVYVLGLKVSDYSVTLNHHNIEKAPKVSSGSVGFASK